MINALSIDLENWYNSEFLTPYLPEEKADQISASIKPIIDLLDKYNTRATFFVLGTVAEQHPEIIKTIYEAGHEIASHGYSHKMLTHLTPDEFEHEIIKSVKLLENIIGKRPEGYRAASFSLNNKTKWALDILVKYGFKYDASIFPIKTNLYGVPDAPLIPYRPSMEDIAKNDPDGKILEFPMTVARIGVNLPVTGGFYLRSLPMIYQKCAIKSINRTRPIILYFHPWETYISTPRLNNIPWFSRFVTYYGIKTSLRKIEMLLKSFKFAPLAEVFKVQLT
jgi:peptidoglycan-N-acetylglucosamine deacetylase